MSIILPLGGLKKKEYEFRINLVYTMGLGWVQPWEKKTKNFPTSLGFNRAILFTLYLLFIY